MFSKGSFLKVVNSRDCVVKISIGKMTLNETFDGISEIVGQDQSARIPHADLALRSSYNKPTTYKKPISIGKNFFWMGSETDGGTSKSAGQDKIARMYKLILSYILHEINTLEQTAEKG